MTRYLRISGLCFSLAVIVSLFGFVATFAEESADQATVDTVQSSEKQEQPKMNQETDTQRYKKAKEKSSTKDKRNTAPQGIDGPSKDGGGVGDNVDPDSDNDGIPDGMESATNGNSEEAIPPSDGQQNRAKNVVKFKAGNTGDVDERQKQPNPKPVEATTVKSSKSNSSERQVQPAPEPVDGKTKGSKSNTSE